MPKQFTTHWGGFPPTWYSSPLSQLEAIRLREPVNLGWDRGCSTDGTPCTQDADCPPEATCVSAFPTLSLKHQVSFVDHRTLSGGGAQPDRSADRGVVQAQLADAAGEPVGNWLRLVPFVNVYDAQASSNYTNCTFDPIAASM